MTRQHSYRERERESRDFHLISKKSQKTSSTIIVYYQERDKFKEDCIEIVNSGVWKFLTSVTRGENSVFTTTFL